MNFKKFTALTMLVLTLTACGKPYYSVENKKEYPTYGLLNQDSIKSDKMCYELSIGNIVWSVLLINTVVAPIYFIGFSLYNPIGEKTEKGCGIDKE